MITTTSTSTPDLPSTSTTSPKETTPDAAALWATTIEALRVYQAECAASDDLDLSRDLDRDAKRAGEDK